MSKALIEWQSMKSIKDKEIDTILAALRLYQHWRVGGRVPQGKQAAAIKNIATQHGSPLDGDEIDALCEFLNS